MKKLSDTLRPLRCDYCGRFMRVRDAVSIHISDDTHFTAEVIDVVHKKCAKRERA